MDNFERPDYGFDGGQNQNYGNGGYNPGLNGFNGFNGFNGGFNGMNGLGNMFEGMFGNGYGNGFGNMFGNMFGNGYGGGGGLGNGNRYGNNGFGNMFGNGNGYYNHNPLNDLLNSFLGFNIFRNNNYYGSNPFFNPYSFLNLNLINPANLPFYLIKIFQIVQLYRHFTTNIRPNNNYNNNYNNNNNDHRYSFFTILTYVVENISIFSKLFTYYYYFNYELLIPFTLNLAIISLMFLCNNKAKYKKLKLKKIVKDLIVPFSIISIISISILFYITQLSKNSNKLMNSINLVVFISILIISLLNYKKINLFDNLAQIINILNNLNPVDALNSVMDLKDTGYIMGYLLIGLLNLFLAYKFIISAIKKFTNSSNVKPKKSKFKKKFKIF